LSRFPPDWNAAFVGVLNLMSCSAIHRSWSVADIERLIVPPFRLGQAAILTNDKHQVVAFASWAFLTQEAEAGYIDGTRPLQPDDWSAGDRLWWIDALAPFGHSRPLVHHLRATLRSRGIDHTDIRFRRTYADRRRRYARAMV
jgi:hemolysin-activating ACP:hemolysin acyltransferase